MNKIIGYSFFLALFLLLFKTLSTFVSPLELHGDEAQYWLWSKDLSFGYFSKPPLLPFLIKIFGLVFGSSTFGIKSLSAVFYLLTSFVIYLISKKLFSKNIAIVTSLTFFLMPGVSFSSFIINTDVPLMFFWSASIYFLILQKENHKVVNSIFFGICLGLGMLSKYAMLYFFICFVVYLLINKRFFDDFKNNIGHYILSFTIFLGVVAPNIYWNMSNGWLTFGHTADNINMGSITINFVGFFNFLFAQIFILGPLIFIAAIAYYKKIFVLSEQNSFLLAFSMPVFVFVVLESFFIRAHGNWAAPAFIGLVVFLVRSLMICMPKIVLINNVINFSLALLFFYLVMIGSSYKVFGQLHGYENFTNYLNLKTQDQKITNIVIEERMVFSIVNYRLRNKNLSFYVTKAPGDRVSNHFQINKALSSNFNESFIYVGGLESIGYLKKSFQIIPLKKIKINSDVGYVNVFAIIKQG